MSAAIVTAITNNAVAILTGMGLTYAGKAFVIERRKTPALPQQPNPINPASLVLPEVVVSVGEEGKYQDITAVGRLVNYPMAVTIVTAGGAKLAFDDALATIAENIRYTMTLQTNWASQLGANWNQIDAFGKPPFDKNALEKTLNYRIITFTVQTREPRN